MSVEKVKAALDDLGITSTFEHTELESLAACGFDSKEALLAAEREDLTTGIMAGKLRVARVAIILRQKEGELTKSPISLASPCACASSTSPTS